MVKAWKKVTERLTQELGSELVLLWLSPLIARERGEALVLYASNQHVLAEVRQQFLERIRQILRSVEPRISEVILELGDGLIDQGESTQERVEVRQAPIQSRLDERYTFENYVEGSPNRLAKLTTLQVARQPGAANYNPLVLYGGTGLGKTHLLHAAGNLLRQLNPQARVLYVRSEDFVSAMIKSLRSEAMDQFKALYRSVDCLLIDDIQFFAGKDRTQEEFFHTFNALYDSRQQIVLTCDRFPKELERFEQRLQSRFGWGLSVAVEPPDFETRVGILQAKAERAGAKLEFEVAELIAKRMRSNVRELEGALNTLLARAHFSGREVSLEFAQETLRDLFAVQDRSVSVGSIQKTVAEYYRLSLSDLLSQKRTRSIARARQVAMAVCKELTTLSLKEIGLAFGGRDHTTVLHACKLIEELKRTDGTIHDDWQSLLRKLVG